MSQMFRTTTSSRQLLRTGEPASCYAAVGGALGPLYQNQYIAPVTEKPLVWVGSAREDLRAFPADVRRRAGFELFLVQRGLMPSDWKAMPKVGAGVFEIRIHTGEEHRVFYVAKYEDAVYVLHAFRKKTQKTAARDLELGKNRLNQVVVERAQKKGGRK